jgi:hypothetical protein
MVFQGALHAVSALITNAGHWPAWLAGGVSSNLAGHDPVVAAFWLSWGSFGLPLALLGAVVIGFGRAGRVPPLYLAIGYLIWGVLGGLMAPSPLLTVLIPGALLIIATTTACRRRATAGSVVPG